MARQFFFPPLLKSLPITGLYYDARSEKHQIKRLSIQLFYSLTMGQ